MTTLSLQGVADDAPQLERDDDDGGGVQLRPCAGTNCIKIGLLGKLIFRKRKGLLEVLFS